MNKFNSLIIVCIAYVVALSSSILFIYCFKGNDILEVLFADILATIIIYLFSYFYSNSSIYDPYWSVVPPFILLYWLLISSNINIISIFLISFSVLFWSIRLTYNWVRGWQGIHHEDWRYMDMRKYSGKYFEILNFFGIHLFPTLIVFICCLSLKYTILKDFTLSFILGFLLCLIGVLYEVISDYQLYSFKKINPKGIINSGIWKYSRHPNYYGEMLFWCGIFIYGVTADNFNYLIIGPILMILMFVFISIPWIETKILRTRPEYKSYQSKVSMLFPEISIIKKIIG